MGDSGKYHLDSHTYLDGPMPRCPLRRQAGPPDNGNDTTGVPDTFYGPSYEDSL